MKSISTSPSSKSLTIEKPYAYEKSSIKSVGGAISNKDSRVVTLSPLSKEIPL